MRAVIVTWDGGGNLPPMLGIGRDLTSRGWAVDVLGHRTQRDRIESAGLRFLPATRGGEYESASPRNTLRGLAQMSAAFADRGRGTDAVAASRAGNADVIIVDCLLWGALAECRQAGRPVVSVVHSLWHYFRGVPQGPVGLLARLRGVDPVAAFQNADLTVVTTRPDWEPPRARPLSPGARHTGIVWQGTPVPTRPDQKRPRVLVSLSSTAFPGQLRVLQTVVDALCRLPVDLVVTTGPSIDPAQLRVRRAVGEVEIHAYLDHARLLPTTSVVVGHGGHATTARALARGIPMLILPMHPMLDQPMLGATVQRLGVGRRLPRSASEGAIADAVTALCADTAVRGAAQRLGDEIRRQDGAATAADLIVGLTRA